MTIEGITPFLEQLAKGLAKQFGSKCEVVVHDLTSGLESTILLIENGHVTGRKIGDDASNIAARAIQNPEAAKDNLGYLTRTQDGRLLKSSSIHIKDDNGQPIALLSINYDFTEISHVNTLLEQFMSVQEEKPVEKSIDAISSNVEDLLDKLVEDSVVYVGKPVALMNKEDKVKAIKFLDDKGAFLIMKSGDKISQFFDISKYTLYNYLGEKNGKAADQ